MKGLNGFWIGTLMPLGPLKSPTVWPGFLEWIWRKRHRRQRGIEIRTGIFKVAKYCQVFVADHARERAVVRLPVSRRQRGRERSKVKEK